VRRAEAALDSEHVGGLGCRVGQLADCPFHGRSPQPGNALPKGRIGPAPGRGPFPNAGGDGSVAQGLASGEGHGQGVIPPFSSAIFSHYQPLPGPQSRAETNTTRLIHPGRSSLAISARCSSRSSRLRLYRVVSKGFPSETQVKRGVRIVHGDKELEERVGRNDLCPCGSGKRFKKCCRKTGCF
jgi:hypothetical protein